MRRKNFRYTSEQILNGLDVLALKVGQLALSVEIVSPYFTGQRINGKFFMIPQPLAIILLDVIKYHSGQLYRCYFDTQRGRNITVSISILNNQIFNGKDGEARKKKYCTEFTEIQSKLGEAQRHKKKLRQFSHKYFAHTDAGKSLNESEKELATIGIPWVEFINLINNAKIILNNMYLACGRPKSDFSESAYQDFKQQFWNAVKYKQVNIK